jgi:HAD superfamily hydrolase (TIGR01456 family)
MEPQRQSEAAGSQVAFAFDIDGVLVNGKSPIPGARDTLIDLQEKGIPFIFLTNSGGVTEKVNLEKLATRLGNITFDETQIVQSHTPFRDLATRYHDKTILVLGGHGDNIREVAKAYGFKDVVTSSDIVALDEHVHPFPEMTKSHHEQFGRNKQGREPLKIAAILVWSSPRDWCLDLQLIVDLLMSSQGIVGTRSGLNGNSTLPNFGYLQDGQPELYFCNPDFEWSTKHEHPRFAQGAFREALRGLWTYATKEVAELEYHICGKPTATTYDYGERALQKYITTNPTVNGENVRTIYMIGDNPESDIAGANAYKSECGYQWKSILVETGVYRAGAIPTRMPNHTAKDVKAAVEWAISQNSDLQK